MKWQNLPPLLLYPAVIPTVISCCIKHRCSPAIISAANPAFPYGGLPFASKSEMLQPFSQVLPFIHLKKEHSREFKIDQIKNFAEKHGFPVCSKPDTGHRGMAVKKCYTIDDIDLEQPWDIMIQAWSNDPIELGVFYIRYPQQPKGHIHSITLKTMPKVVGNGQSTVHELADQQGLKVTDADPNAIPNSGEIVNLLDTASHSRGADFKDKSELISEAVHQIFQNLCDDKPFYFGRFDLTTPSLEAFKRGEFSIIEVNGATSEFIHIYDDKFSYKQGMTLLAEQWTTLFSIGKQVSITGQKPLSFRQFVQKYFQFFLDSKRATGRFW